MTGKYAMPELKPLLLSDLPNWDELKKNEVNRRPFWWAGKGELGFGWRTLGIRSYLGIIEPNFQVIRSESSGANGGQGQFFGLWDEANDSLVIANDDELITYGNQTAETRLMELIHDWVDRGMPSGASFELSIHPTDKPVTAGPNQWIVKRNESQFLWTLPI